MTDFQICGKLLGMLDLWRSMLVWAGWFFARSFAPLVPSVNSFVAKVKTMTFELVD